MLEVFSSVWPESSREKLAPVEYDLPLRAEPGDAYVGLANLFRDSAGVTFSHGLYRVHGVVSAQRAREHCLRLAPAAGKVTFPFAFDWMGRHLAVDLRDPRNLPVIQFDPAAGKAYESGIPLLEFHDFVAGENGGVGAGEAISFDLFREWREADSRPVEFDECVGLGVPLFLGGEEAVSNLSRSDLDVYWELSCQLVDGVAGVC